MESPQARTLAESSGVAVIERGGALWVIDRGTGSVATAIFVAGLVAGIGLLGGLTLLFVVGWAGLVPLSLGMVGLAGVGLLVRWKRRRAQQPIESLQVLCVIDPSRGTLTNAAGHPIAHLGQVQLRRAFQVTSSSPALELVYPGGKIQLVRGNPFAGGIHDVERVVQHWLTSLRVAAR